MPGSFAAPRDVRSTTRRSKGYPGANLALLLALAGAALLLLAPIKQPFNFYDEGLAVFNAVRVMRGQVPYRDFWSIYSPGQPYALAAVFRLFGANLMSERLFDVAMRLLIVIGAYRIARRVASAPYATLVAIAATVLLASAGTFGYAIFPALALGFLSLLFLFRYVSGSERACAWLVGAGAMAGLVAVFRIDVGGYLALSVALTLLLFHLRGAMWAGAGRGSRVMAALKAGVLFAAGLLTIAAPVYGALFLRAGFSRVWDLIVIFPLTTLHEMRRLPYPGIVPVVGEFEWWSRFYCPILVYGLALAALIGGAVANPLRVRRLVLTAVTIFGALLFAQALNRYDYVHVLPSSILAFLVAAVLVQERRSAPRKGMGNVAAALLAISLLLYVILPARVLCEYMTTFEPWRCYSVSPRSSCIPLLPGEGDIAQYLRLHVPKGAPIFIGNQRHDRIWVNDVGLYFLTGRPSATYYSELHPGVATTLPVQRHIVAELEAKNVDWIALMNAIQSREPNGSRHSSGVTYLDDFVRAHYRRAATFGPYSVWHRGG